MLTKAQYETGDYGKAKFNYLELLKAPQTISHGNINRTIYYDLGRIAKNEGKFDEAINYFKKSIDVFENQRSSINTEVSKIGFVGDKMGAYCLMIDVLFERGNHQRAFEYAERAKARALVDMLAAIKDFRENVGKEKCIGINTLLDEIDKSEKKSIAIAYSGRTDDIDKVRALKRQKNERISNDSPELSSLVSVSSTGVKSFQFLLSPRETLIEYYYHSDDIFVFIATRDSVKGIKLDGKGINDEVKTFRTQIMETLTATIGIAFKVQKPTEVAEQTPKFAQLLNAGRGLYQKIFKPLEGMIKTKNITIVPHGALHYLPFNALISDDEYLIDKYNVRVLPSASVIRFLETKREGRAGDLIVFGNPDLGDSKYDLPGAQEEAFMLKNLEANSKILLRKEASESAVKKFCGEFKYVHFACHSTFNPDKPLESGLMLSKDNQNDGMLTVNELYDMRLNSDLVTLSACETALGKVANGDDVVGFTRGFLYAGTNSIVSSLWQVDDKATSILMQEFYKNLKDKDKRTALRLGQMKVKNTYNSHPFFWAAFQLTGAVQ